MPDKNDEKVTGEEKAVNVSDDEIDFSTITSFERSYDFLPYTPATIKNYLKQAGFELEWVCGYKEGRYPGYKRRYNVIKIATSEVVQRRVTLDDMRRVLARAGCPLPPQPRHSGAVNFLKAVAEVTGKPVNEIESKSNELTKERWKQ